jgi:hypothetical protein
MMNINEGVNWSRTFYGDSEDDMRYMEILKDLGYTFIKHELVAREFPIYMITGHKENL